MSISWVMAGLWLAAVIGAYQLGVRYAHKRREKRREKRRLQNLSERGY